MKHEYFGADWTKYAEVITTSCFMANNASPWQQRLMNGQKLQYLASSRSRDLAEHISGGSDQPTRSGT